MTIQPVIQNSQARLRGMESRLAKRIVNFFIAASNAECLVSSPAYKALVERMKATVASRFRQLETLRLHPDLAHFAEAQIA